MNYLALDLSTKSSGVAYFENSILTEYEEIKSTSKDLINRIKKMQEGILEFLQDHPDIDTVVLEEVHPDSGLTNLKTHRALMWVQGAVATTIHDFNNKIKIEYMYPSTWRAKIGIQTGKGIKRETLKKADIQYVKDNFNIEPGEDACDAICLGCAYINTIENELNWE